MLRELRRQVPTSTEVVLTRAELAATTPSSSSSAAAAASSSSSSSATTSAAAPPPVSAALAPQLRLLAAACAHEKVCAEVQRLGSGEGAYDRLLALVLPGGASVGAGKLSSISIPTKGGAPAAKPGGGSAEKTELIIEAMGLLVALAAGGAGKAALKPHAKPLCSALALHLVGGGGEAARLAALRNPGSPSFVLAEQSATLLGKLSTAAAFRAEMLGGHGVKNLLSLLGEVPTGAGEDTLLPNALAALHNCSTTSEGAPRSRLASSVDLGEVG